MVAKPLTLRLTVTKAGVRDGTLVVDSPYTSLGAGWYCPAQSVTASLSAS